MSHETVALADLAWTEVRERLDSGTDTVVLPVASVEQHGPHLPLSTDVVVGEALAERIARSLGDALVAPTVRPGHSPVHGEFSGTLSVPPEALMDTVRTTVETLVDHGFEHVAVLASHGGNFPAVDAVVPGLARDLTAETVTAVGSLQRYTQLLNEGLREAGVDYEEPVVHAGATETSLMLAIDESLVRTDAAPTGYEGEVAASTLFGDGIGHYDESGVLGDATRATAAAGERILERVTEAYVAEVEAERASG